MIAEGEILTGPLIIAIGAVISAMMIPLGAYWLQKLTGKQRATDRQAEWDRQDEIEARAISRDNELLNNNKRIANSTATLGIDVSDLKVVVGEVKELGETTHKFLNSDKTEQKQRELDGLKREIVMMRKLIGNPATEEEAEALKSTEHEIETLTSVVFERRIQQVIADKEALKKADER